MADRLEAVRVELEGPVASFRYPHFLIGRQPSYPMPPPSTIYGLVSAALGYFPDPKHLAFAYRFYCERARVDDLETIWFVEPNTATRGAASQKNLEATSNVLPREWLVSIRMTLFLAGNELDVLEKAFRSPHYLLTLGRSQELVSIRRVERVVLHPAQSGRLEPGLLPLSLRAQLPMAIAVYMPRFIPPRHRWPVLWDWFLVLDVPFPVQATNEVSFWTEDVEAAEPRILTFHQFRL
ncbi:CRISPR-associated protein Cas5 [Rhodothermus bifroesti]|nr:CRISPR-associated protein Cas5 [Rhodothermus bifroesti]GBD01749.1 hypothetical protein HRbin18_01476 [bacterium HR18]